MEDTTERGRLERAAEKVGRVAKLAGPTMGILAVSLFDVQHGASLAAELEHSDLDFMEVPVEMESSRTSKRMGVRRNGGGRSNHGSPEQNVRVDSNRKQKSKQKLDRINELQTHLKVSQNARVEARVAVSACWYDFMNSFGHNYGCFIAFDKNSDEWTVVEAALRELSGINNSMWFEKDNVVTVRVTCNTLKERNDLIEYCTTNSIKFNNSRTARQQRESSPQPLGRRQQWESSTEPSGARRQRFEARTDIFPVKTHCSFVANILQALILSEEDGKFTFEVASTEMGSINQLKTEVEATAGELKILDSVKKKGRVFFGSFDEAARCFMRYHKGVQKKLSTSASRSFTPRLGKAAVPSSSTNCTLKFILGYDRDWPPISLIHICKAFGVVEDACVVRSRNILAESEGEYDVWVRFKNPADAQLALNTLEVVGIPKEVLKQVAFAYYAFDMVEQMTGRGDSSRYRNQSLNRPYISQQPELAGTSDDNMKVGFPVWNRTTETGETSVSTSNRSCATNCKTKLVPPVPSRPSSWKGHRALSSQNDSLDVVLED